MFEALLGMIEGGGALGLAILMFLENLFPPIPSEMIVPLAGFLVGQGKMGLIGAIMAASFGSCLGAVVWYGLGRAVGRARMLHLITRFGLWATLTPDEALRAFAWFETHGPKIVFWGRMVPGVRTLISVPAGIAAMPFWRFLILTAAGSLLWVSFLMGAGLWLQERYTLVSHWLDPVSKAVLALCLGIYLFRLCRLLLRRR